MLTLIEGGFFSEKDEYLKNALILRCNEKKRTFLIVPEQQTVITERLTTDYLPPDAPFYFEATNFTRWEDSIFRMLGGRPGATVSKKHKALIMWRTLGELSPFIDFCRGTEVTRATVERSMNAVAAMDSLGITADGLAEAKERIKRESLPGTLRLDKKLSDLFAIMSLYERLLKEGFGDVREPLSRLSETLASRGAEALSDTDIYIDGFTSFTEPQYKLIERLISLTNVYITLVLPKHGGDAFEYTETKKTHERLLKIASRESVPVKLVRPELSLKKKATFRDICDSLFHTGRRITEDEHLSDVRVFEAKTPYEECDFILADIKRRVMEGARYSDFAIITRSLSDYTGILDTAAERAGLPVFMSGKRDIASVEAIKLIYTAISAVAGGFSQTDVITYAKCSLSGVDRDLADELEIYVKTWQISGKRFTDGIDWNMNPLGYTARRSPDVGEKLIRLNETKAMIIEPLLSLKESFSDAVTVVDYARALFSFLSDISLEKRLKEKAALLLAEGNEESASANERVFELIVSALDSLVETVAETKIGTKTFLSLLKIVFSYEDIRRIPSYTDEITAASADTARLTSKKHIYVMGLNFGSFPKSVFDDAYFTAKESETLEAAGLPAVADREVRASRELYYILRAISLADETLTLSYTTRGASFEPTSRSDALTRLQEITYDILAPRRISSLPVLERIYTPEQALIEEYTEDEYKRVKAALLSVGLSEKTRIYEADIKNVNARLSPESTDLIYKKDVTLSQSRIDSYVSCPMSYFCKYNLRLGTEERAELDARGIGSFIHAILERFFIELKARGRAIGDITEEEKDEIVRSAARSYLSAVFEGAPLESARMRVNIDRLCRAARPAIESLCLEFRNCRFEPVFFELKIDRSKSAGPGATRLMTDDGRIIHLEGVIDRVDVYSKDGRAYVRVVDYKTGSKSFSPADLEAGRNLQMFLYLKSITETEKPEFKKRLGIEPDGQILPAGVIYVKADMSDGKIKKNDSETAFLDALKRQSRLGMLLDDDESLYSMNTDYLPLKKDKSGALKKDPDKLYTLSGWDEISHTLEDVIKDVGERMFSGDISPTPLKKGGKGEHCEYCDFKPFCRNAKV